MNTSPKMVGLSSRSFLLMFTACGTPFLHSFKLLICVLFLCSSITCAQGPFSSLPAEYKVGQPPGRSPLVFNDGTPVHSAEDWPRRRAEILASWHGKMGPWPAVLQEPEITVLETTTREGGITQKKVSIEIAPGQIGLGYVFIPPGAKAAPAVFVPYYDPETSAGIGKKPIRDFAWQLAKRGFVTLAVGSPGGDARAPVLSESAKCQPLSYLGYISANMWQALASMPEVDSQRIGIVGHSYGGKWAMFGSCLWERFACAVWSDAGVVFDESRRSINYQEPWYLGWDTATTRLPGLIRPESPRTGAYKALVEAGHDLPELQALMAPRPFLVSGGEEDPPKRWLPLRHAIAVNQLLGYADRVSMTNRLTHDPTEESNAQIYQFFEFWLKPKND